MPKYTTKNIWKKLSRNGYHVVMLSDRVVVTAVMADDDDGDDEMMMSVGEGACLEPDGHTSGPRTGANAQRHWNSSRRVS